MKAEDCPFWCSCHHVSFCAANPVINDLNFEFFAVHAMCFSVVDKTAFEFILEFQGIYLCENIRQFSAQNPSHGLR
jgi:hypothetical protein